MGLKIVECVLLVARPAKPIAKVLVNWHYEIRINHHK